MKNAIEQVEKIRQQRKRKPRPKKKKKERKPRSENRRGNFQCPFCNNWLWGSKGYHDNVKEVLLSTATKLLNSDNNNQGYFEGVSDFVFEVFGKECVMLNETLEREGYLEKFSQRHFNKEANLVCPFCEYEKKKGKDYHKSPLKRIFIERAISLLNEPPDSQNGRYQDAVIGYIFKVLGAGNIMARETLTTRGFLERSSELYGEEQDDGFIEHELIKKEQCPECKNFYRPWDMTLDDSPVARRICEFCMSKNPQKETMKPEETVPEEVILNEIGFEEIPEKTGVEND